MMLTPQQILDEIEALPAEAKAEVVDLLLEKYDPPAVGAEIEAAWLKAANERLEQIRSGKAQLHRATDVFNELDARPVK